MFLTTAGYVKIKNRLLCTKSSNKRHRLFARCEMATLTLFPGSRQTTLLTARLSINLYSPFYFYIFPIPKQMNFLLGWTQWTKGLRMKQLPNRSQTKTQQTWVSKKYFSKCSIISEYFLRFRPEKKFIKNLWRSSTANKYGFFNN